jgi:hypothetical protein
MLSRDYHAITILHTHHIVISKAFSDLNIHGMNTRGMITFCILVLTHLPKAHIQQAVSEK